MEEHHKLGHEIDSTFVLSSSFLQQCDELAALADAELGIDGTEMVPSRIGQRSSSDAHSRGPLAPSGLQVQEKTGFQVDEPRANATSISRSRIVIGPGIAARNAVAVDGLGALDETTA